jgi:hypothetical protein
VGHALMGRLTARALGAWDRRRDRSGQGTVEYIGMVVMVTLLVAALATVGKGWAGDIGGVLKKLIVDSIKRIASGIFGTN